jgi:hypothetical protein
MSKATAIGTVMITIGRSVRPMLWIASSALITSFSLPYSSFSHEGKAKFVCVGSKLTLFLR